MNDAPLLGDREPLAIRAAVVAAVTVILDLLVAFGFDLTEEQYASIVAATSLIGMLVIVLWVRPKVTPVADPNLPMAFDAPDHDDELDTIEDPDLLWDDEPVDDTFDDLAEDYLDEVERVEEVVSDDD